MLGPHTTKDWPHEKSLQLGMYDTRDLIKRSERCLSCHLGTPEKFVDHEMIAAGHPDLTFELNLFSSVMPMHWKEPQDNAWRGVQVWSVGEAVQLQKGLERLARRASSASWPEYGELDCFACHHSLTKPEDSWRQSRDMRVGRREFPLGIGLGTSCLGTSRKGSMPTRPNSWTGYCETQHLCWERGMRVRKTSPPPLLRRL